MLLKFSFFLLPFCLLASNFNANATQSSYSMSYRGGVIYGGCEFYVEYNFDTGCMCGSLYGNGPCGNINITWGIIAGEGEPETVASYEELIGKYEIEGDIDDTDALVAIWNAAVEGSIKGD